MMVEGINASTSDVYELISGNQNFGINKHSLVINSILLIIVGSSALFCNISLLASSKFKKSIWTVRYGLIYVSCIVNVFICLIWIPFHLITTFLSYFGYVISGVICYVKILTFYFLLTVILSNITMILSRRVRHSFKSCKYKKKDFILELVVSVVLGMGSSSLAYVSYKDTWDYFACTDLSPSNHSHTYRHVLLALYFTAMSVVSLCFIFLYVHVYIKYHNPDMKQSLYKSNNVTYEDQSLIKEANELNSKRSSNSEPSTVFTVFSTRNDNTDNCKLDKRAENKVKKNVPKEFELNETSYMPSGFKYAKNVYGRRHTVANILDQSDHSKNEPGGNSTRDKSNSYDYVRKFSVDINALQEQLGNPVSFKKPTPFIVPNIEEESSPLKGKNEKSKKSSVSEVEVEKNAQTVDFATDENKEILTVGTWEKLSCTNDNSALSINKKVSGASQSVIMNEEAMLSVDSRLFKQLEEQLNTIKICLAVIGVHFMCIIPHCVSFWLQKYVEKSLFNICYLTPTICLFITPMHVFLIAWLEYPIHLGLKRLYSVLTDYKCVCYCNVHLGKCFFRDSSVE